MNRSMSRNRIRRMRMRRRRRRKRKNRRRRRKSRSRNKNSPVYHCYAQNVIAHLGRLLSRPVGLIGGNLLSVLLFLLWLLDIYFISLFCLSVFFFFFFFIHAAAFYDNALFASLHVIFLLHFLPFRLKLLCYSFSS